MTTHPFSPLPFKLELCTDEVAVALAKADLVDQIEFCADLKQDGLTPSLKDVGLLVDHLKKPLKVIIRHRSGNFEYGPDDLAVMIRQAAEFQARGVSRFVFGALKHRRLDLTLIADFCSAVFPSTVCIHKAIDESSEILLDLQQLLRIPNVNEILTSGGCTTALEGADMITNMIKLSGSRLEIIAAGNITSQNLDRCHEKIRAPIYHGKRIVDLPGERVEYPF